MTTGSIVVGNGGKAAIVTGGITIDAGVGISAGVVGGADGSLSSPWPTR